MHVHQWSDNKHFFIFFWKYSLFPHLVNGGEEHLMCYYEISHSSADFK